jgi:hypothetical protein
MGAQRTPFAPFSDTWREWLCDTVTALDKDGYGQGRRGKRRGREHRLTWEDEYGPIPDGLHVLHHCDVRHCRRIQHLWLGTNDDNVRDRDEKGRGVNFSNGPNNSDRPRDLSHRTKLFTPQRREIIKQRAAGVDVMTLAKQYDVHCKTIQKIWRNRHNDGWDK